MIKNAILLCISLLFIFPTNLLLLDSSDFAIMSYAQLEAPDTNNLNLNGTSLPSISESTTNLQMQCAHTPILPERAQAITITARIVDGESLAPKVAEMIEIKISTNETGVAIPNNIVNNQSTLNYTVGPFMNLTAISYSCHGLDDNRSEIATSENRTLVIGEFVENRATPVLYTGSRIANLDILFIADNMTFSTYKDPNFLTDVQRAIQAYHNQSILLENQDKTNFWIAQDMGQAKDGCESLPPANWNEEYFSFDAAVILHREDSIQDCTMAGKELSTANMATVVEEGYLILHEIAHRPFGLADEYDNPSTPIISHPYQNIFNTLEECERVKNEILAELLLDRSCRKIPFVIDGTEYYTFDTKPDDLMVDNKQFQILDLRRIEKWFEECLTPLDNIPPPKDHCRSGAE